MYVYCRRMDGEDKKIYNSSLFSSTHFSKFMCMCGDGRSFTSPFLGKVRIGLRG